MTNLTHRLELMMANLLLSEHYNGFNINNGNSQYVYECHNDGTKFIYESKNPNPDDNPVRKEAIQYIVDWMKMEYKGDEE